MFEKDLANEAIISQWIRDYFFSTNEYQGDFEYITDIESQKKGMDLVLHSHVLFGDNARHVIDEKSASNYIKINDMERNMPTFAFELDYQGVNGKRNDGWLFGNQFKETEYYLINWLWAGNYSGEKGQKKDIDVTEITYDSLTKAKCLLIKKEDIQDYLKKFKVTSRNYRIVSERIRNKSIIKENKKSLDDNFKFPRVHYSPQLAEKPVNVVIHQNDLEKLAVKRICIGKDNVKID
ncbi:hypothetical protein [Enterococcus sp. LJL90]